MTTTNCWTSSTSRQTVQHNHNHEASHRRRRSQVLPVRANPPAPLHRTPQLTLPQCNSQERHDLGSRRPRSRLSRRLRRPQTLPTHPQPDAAIQSLPCRIHRLLRCHHRRRPRRPRLRENQPPRSQLPRRAPGPTRQAARRSNGHREGPALGQREQIFDRCRFVGG